jgi:CDP-diglyceride synthetase
MDLQRLPLDCGLRIRGRRLLGQNKTVRGLITIVVALILWMYFQEFIQWYFSIDPKLNLVDYNFISPACAGLLLGMGWTLGELPNSFVKRQLDIDPGATAPGYLSWFFWILDQIDSIVGVLLVSATLLEVTLCQILFICFFGFILHPVADLLMIACGLKRRRKITV